MNFGIFFLLFVMFCFIFQAYIQLSASFYVSNISFLLPTAVMFCGPCPVGWLGDSYLLISLTNQIKISQVYKYHQLPFWKMSFIPQVKYACTNSRYLDLTRLWTIRLYDASHRIHVCFRKIEPILYISFSKIK